MNPRRTRMRAGVAAIVVAVTIAGLAGCSGSADDAYDGLSADELTYVIPGSEGWGAGRLCEGDDGACGIEFSVDTLPQDIETVTWHHVSAVGEASEADGMTLVEIEIVGDSGNTPLSLSMLERDIPTVRRVVGDGYQVWMGERGGHVSVVAAFDDEGRIAAVGRAAAAHFTIPFVRVAAADGADTALGYLESLIVPRPPD